MCKSVYEPEHHFSGDVNYSLEVLGQLRNALSHIVLKDISKAIYEQRNKIKELKRKLAQGLDSGGEEDKEDIHKKYLELDNRLLDLYILRRLLRIESRRHVVSNRRLYHLVSDYMGR